MDVLFKELSPITTKIAFICGDINIIVKTFLEWQTPLISAHNNSFKKTILTTDLKSTLMELCPLTTGEKRRYLFIQTTNNWVAFFDNGHTGTDRSAPEVLSKKLKSKHIYISYNFDTKEVLFDYYDLIGNNFDLIRSIATIKEGKWIFHQYGTPLLFEKTEYYKSKQIKNRFNIEILLAYLTEFDINVFNENYYAPKKGAILLNKQGPKFNTTKTLQLNEAQDFFS
jgi:hypothetical protein